MTAPDDLLLYGFPSCPYCKRVRRTAARLGLELTERDIHSEPSAMKELLAARAGRKTVPVLRIGAGDGPYEWMPESSHIVRYLQDRFGDGKRHIDLPMLARRAVIWAVGLWLVWEIARSIAG